MLNSGDKNSVIWLMRCLAIEPLPSPGVPHASNKETKSAMGDKWAAWLHAPGVFRVMNALNRGTKSAVAYKREAWLRNPCLLEGSQGCGVEHEMSGGPKVGRLAT